MTTSPITSITDELLAELEAKASGKRDEGFHLVHNIPAETILALLAERAELKRDADRYNKWLFYCFSDPARMAKILGPCDSRDQVDQALDAMQEAKP